MNEFSKRIALISGVLLIGVVIGRYTLPAKIEKQTEIKEVIKYVEKNTENEKKKKKNNKEVIVVETVYPNGKRVKKTHIVDKGTITVDLTKTQEKTTDIEKDVKTSETITYSKNDWSLHALAAVNLFETNKVFTYGAMVNRRILGPFYLGGFVFTDKTAGGSLGVIF